MFKCVSNNINYISIKFLTKKAKKPLLNNGSCLSSSCKLLLKLLLMAIIFLPNDVLHDDFYAVLSFFNTKDIFQTTYINKYVQLYPSLVMLYLQVWYLITVTELKRFLEA